MIIEDGKGTGKKASVSSEGFIKVASVQVSVEHHINHHHGEAYNFVFDVTPAGADDCFIYMKNTSDKDLILEGIYISVAGACEVYMQLNADGTRNSATAYTPVNLNAGSGKTAEGTFEYGTDLAGGAATLAGGTEAGRGVFRAAGDTKFFNFDQDIIIPKNKTYTLWSSASVAINGMLAFNYHLDELG
jgi:hypothetical protein